MPAWWSSALQYSLVARWVWAYACYKCMSAVPDQCADIADFASRVQQ